MTLEQTLVRSYWHLVAHRCEVASDRDYARLRWPLGDLVLYNDKGAVIAFDNICPHRGARFFQGDAGTASALCPYHGWSYRGGKLRVPKPETYRPCDLAEVRLNQYRIAWCGDFLFAAVAPANDLKAQLADAWPLLEAMSTDIRASYALQTARLECPWRIAVENALEPDHVHMVHAETLGKLDLTNQQNSYFAQNSLLSADIGNARSARALDSMSRFFDLAHPFRGYRALYLFPFGFVTSTFGYTYALQTFMPASDGSQTHFRSRILTARTTVAPHVTEQFFASVTALNRQVFEEDHEICRRIDTSFPLQSSGVLSATEEKIRHFRLCLEDVAIGRDRAGRVSQGAYATRHAAGTRQSQTALTMT